ncbi:MAG: tetratricopeptide repeat protein, partial [Bryobacteraceae bacterium]
GSEALSEPGPAGAPPGSGRSAPRRLDLWISLALAVSVFAIYFQVRNFEFIGYDDPEFLVKNIHIRDGLTPASIAWALKTGCAANWFPLTWLSYMLGVDLYGLASGWHHVTNVFLHALNTLLLFAVLRRMTGERWRSAFVALLFAIHPLHVEPVAWVAERREVLSGLFWFLSMWVYLRYIERPRATAYTLLVLAFGCGLMSKPMIVTLPFALLLLDFWPLQRWGTVPLRRLILEKVPLVVLSAAASVITLLVQQGAGATSSLAEVPFKFRIENAVVSYLAYIFQFFWPARLAVLYPYATGLPAWQVIGAGAVLAAITALAIAGRKRRPYLPVGWFWFAGTLVPVIGLVQVGVQSRADRYMYIPLVGLSVIVVWGLGEIAGHLPRRRAEFRSLAAALAAIACCAYGVVAWSTAAHWRNTVTLFRHAVEVTHDNWAALTTLSQVLLTEDRVDEAMPYIAEALRLRPNLPEAHINFGAALSKRGDFDAAAAQYRIALKGDPNNADAQEGLGVVLAEKGQFAEALANLNAAAKSSPDDADIHYNLGRLYGLAGRPDLAVAEFAETARLQPENAKARFNLGTAYAAQERFSEACGQFREALRLKPDYVSARFNLASALANLGRFDEAISHFQEVLRVQPDFPEAAEALQNCLELKTKSAH